MKRLTLLSIVLLSIVLCARAFAAGNVVGLWQFDEGSGQVANDSSGYGNNGQLGSTPNADVNDPTWTAGKFASALQFNGTNNWVQIANSSSLSITGSITLEAWVKLDSYSIVEPIISKWNDISANDRSYALGIDFGFVRFDISHTGLFGGNPCTVITGFGFACTESALVFSTRPIQLGKWTHVAGVFDTSTKTLQVFIDGVLSNSLVAEKSNIFDIGDPLLIGAADFGGSTRRFFPGAIDEARVWKRVLTPAEVLSSAQAGLRGLWHFNNDGTDSSGLGNDVTLSLTGATFTPNAMFGGNALAVDGTAGFASAPTSTSLEITGSITVEAWVKINSLPSCAPGACNTFVPVAAKWNDEGTSQRGYALAITPDGSVRFDVSHNGGFNCGLFDNTGPRSCAGSNGAFVTSSAKITLGTWAHVAGVFDSSTQTLQVFVNGAPDTSISALHNNIFLNTQPLLVGAADEGSIGRQFTNGSIDELQIWARPLSAAEIAFQASGATAGEVELAGTIDNDNSGAVFESLWQPGETTPAMVLEFIVPDIAGTQITSIGAPNGKSKGKVARLLGWVTGNGALDALMTGSAIHDRNLHLDIGLSDNSELDVQIQWDPAGPAH